MNGKMQLISNSSFIIYRSSLQERMCRMKFVLITLAMAFVLALPAGARAQEPELVNEIVARVNNDIITRVDYVGAMEAFKEELRRQNPNKSEAELNAEYERVKSTILDLMIEDM